MFTIKQKAIKFRNAIYRAKKHGDLDWHAIALSRIERKATI